MLSLSFTLEGMTSEEFNKLLDNAIALNDPPEAVNNIDLIIKAHNVRCNEIEDYLKNDQQLHGTKYQQSPAFLIYGTYFRIKAAARERKQFLDPDFSINKFKLWNTEKCCVYCQKQAKKKYNKSTLPELPHHVGCECMLMPIFD